MNATEKKLMENLSAGKISKIKASDEVIETIVDGAREELEDIKNELAEEESQPENEQNQNYIEALEKRAEYFENVILNGEKFFEEKEKAEMIGELLSEEY